MNGTVRRHSVLALIGLAGTVLWAAASSAAAHADDDPGIGASLGATPSASGALTLPASGFEVSVPKPFRSTTEAFGRISFRPDGPEVSDEIAVETAEGPLALSVIVGAASCDTFDALGSVERGVKVGRTTWSRLDQTLSAPPVQAGAVAPTPLKATIWCRPGIVVHTVAGAAHPGVALWLDALAKLKPPSSRAAAATAPLEHVFLERPESPDEVFALPVQQRFVIAAVDAVWETETPVGRVPPPEDGAAEDLAAPPPDRFELLVPRAWLVRLEIARDSSGCTVPKRVPRGLPEAPPGLAWTSVAAKVAVLCGTLQDGSNARFTLSAVVPIETALTAAMPILGELARLTTPTETP